MPADRGLFKLRAFKTGGGADRDKAGRFDSFRHNVVYS